MAISLNGLTGISGVDGTSAAPSYKGSDTNTGISFGTDTVTINTGGVARVTTDASGNVGIGTSSVQNKLQVLASDSVNSVGSSTASINISNSYTAAFGKSSDLLFSVGVGAASEKIAGVSGVYTLYNTSVGGDIVFSTNNGSSSFAERMRLDSSGNLGLGVTPSAWVAGHRALQFSQNTSLSSVGNSMLLAQNYYTDGTSKYIASGYAALYEQNKGDGGHKWYTAPSGTAGNAISFTQAMTLDASGNLALGQTSASYKLDVVAGNATAGRFYTTGDINNATLRLSKSANDTSTANRFIIFTINNDGIGSGQINANGGSQAAFGSFSDRRLKTNIVDLQPQLPKIMALRPVEFDYIESMGGGHQTSFIAQEFEEVYPDAVGEDENGMKTLTGWGKTEARLVKAIQELKAEVDSLKAQLQGAA